MKHLLVLSALFVLSAASAISKERPEFCDWGKAGDKETSCRNDDTTYTYDHKHGTCQRIARNGCVDADNIFASEEECMATCGVATRYAVEPIASDVKFDVFHFNSFIDKVLGKISSGMKSLGADPIAVDGFVLDQIPNLRLGFQDGSLTGLSNIVRVGDWAFSVDGVTHYSVHGGVGLHDVKGQFTAVGELNGHGGETTVSVAMNKFDVTFSFYADVKKCTIGIDKFTLGEGLELKIDIAAGSFLDPVLSETVTSTTNYLVGTFNKIVETATLTALGSVNVCELVAAFVASG